MNEKKNAGSKLDNFFAGKGFYIVLFLCVAIIGVSTYFLLTNRGADVEGNLSQTVVTQDSPEVSAAPPAEATAPVVEDAETVDPPSISEDDANQTLNEDEAEVWNEEEAEASASAQFIWPVSGEITLQYSVAALIYNEKMGDWRTSDGVEITAPLGTQVVAVSAGTVTSVSYDDRTGMTVVIEHAGGLKSVYSNLASVPTVYEGDSVMTGEVIGAVGATALGETQENPHLCFKMTLDGVSVDPHDYLPVR